jgi:hypothetical protein
MNKNYKGYQSGEERFEFLFFINEKHLICKRAFDVRDYNDKSRESLEIKTMMDSIAGMNLNSIGTMGIIPTFLKKRSIEDSWLNYRPYINQTQEDVLYNNTQKQNSFKFEVRVDGETLATSYFDGNNFSPSARWDINILELVPEILSEIRYYLSKKNYTKNYGSVKLKRHNIFLGENVKY